MIFLLGVVYSTAGPQKEVHKEYGEFILEPNHSHFLFYPLEYNKEMCNRLWGSTRRFVWPVVCSQRLGLMHF